MSDLGAGDRSHEEYCAAVEAEVAHLTAVVDGVDPATPVPTCPGWTVAALIKHVGLTHRWVEHMVRQRARERVAPRGLDIGLPDAEADYAAWLGAGAGPLVTVLRETDLAVPIWSWGLSGSAAWWSRRMLHETTVHRADAELALGRVPDIDPETACDGIDEFLANLDSHPRAAAQVAELRADGQTVHLHATDSGGEWMIGLRSGGYEWERGHGKGTVAVQGETRDLLLLTYGRMKPSEERFTVFGDRGTLEYWLEKTVF